MFKRFLLIGLLLMLAMGLLVGNTRTVSGRLITVCCDISLSGHTIVIEQQQSSGWFEIDTTGDNVTKTGGFFGSITFNTYPGVLYRARARTLPGHTYVTGNNSNLIIRAILDPHMCEFVAPIIDPIIPGITTNPGEGD